MLSAGDTSRQFMPPVDTVRPHHGPQNILSPRSSQAADNLQHPESLDRQDMMQDIWIVTGPAGCGKTTVAQGLAKELSLPYIEGDDYHSASNKSKMADGTPLTDADRWDWLIQLRHAALASLKPSSDSETKPHGVVVTCSALKHKYRDVIRVASYCNKVNIHFVFLWADEETLLRRVNQRQGHYMKSNMVLSQLEMLEVPSEEKDALLIDCVGGPAEVQQRVNEAVREVLEKEMK